MSLNYDYFGDKNKIGKNVEQTLHCYIVTLFVHWS